MTEVLRHIDGQLRKCWSDSSGNLWDATNFTLEEATRKASKMHFCSNCINCTKCDHCVNCVCCSNCIYCQMCENCARCRECGRCLSCSDTSNSYACSDMSRSRECQHCHLCTNCLYLSNCCHSRDCSHCDSCRDCFQSSGCKYCVNTRHCKDCLHCYCIQSCEKLEHLTGVQQVAGPLDTGLLVLKGDSVSSFVYSYDGKTDMNLNLRGVSSSVSRPLTALLFECLSVMRRITKGK